MDVGIEALALDLYGSLLDGRGLLDALDAVAKRLAATSYAAHEIRFRNGRPERVLSTARGGVAGRALDAYAREWAHRDPWVQVRAAQPLGVYDTARHIAPTALRRTPIWNEWGRPNGAALHGLTAVLARAGAGTAALVFHRREDAPPFAPEDERLLDGLFPHLRRAFAARGPLVGLQEASVAALKAALDAVQDGVALLDPEGRTVFANLALQRMADLRDGLRLSPQGLLEADDPAVRQALSRAVMAAIAALDGRLGLLPMAGSLAVPRPSGASPWLLRALPARHMAAPEAPPAFRGVMLLVTDTARRGRPNATLLARMFNLTPAEAALAAALAAGRTPAEHAATRGVSPETVRSHLAGIRRKTGCRRQAELTALLARLGVSSTFRSDGIIRSGAALAGWSAHHGPAACLIA